MSRDAWHRRDVLISWFERHDEAYTATEIVNQTEIYSGHGRYDRCFDDLKALWKRGLVDRLPGRPAKWRF